MRSLTASVCATLILCACGGYGDGGYTITWSALSGPSASAHVHGPGSATDVAGELVDFAPTGQTTNFGSMTRSITAADIRSQGGQPAIPLDSLVKLLGNGNAYLDVHTNAHVDGEIRGQVVGTFRLARERPGEYGNQNSIDIGRSAQEHPSGAR